jgi:SAM-dependent methyltransferase
MSVRRRLKAAVPRRWVPMGSFARECLKSMGVSPGQTLTPLQQLYVDFALSTNDRGAWAAEIIERFRSVRGRRCLDVGCAYGGFLVGLGRLGAKDLVGIDIDERLLGLARLNLQDHRIAATLRIADIHDEATVERLGLFDVIVCNDVLEHVRDLPTTIRNLCRMTADGGLVYAVIPNKNFPRYLLQDSHYQLQGLTCLSHRDAERYYSAVMGSAGRYDVGFYRPLQYYLSHFRRHGVDVDVFKSGIGIYDMGALADEFGKVREQFNGFDHPAAPPALMAKISRRFEILHRVFTAMMARYDQARKVGDPVAERLSEDILRRFGMEAWCLVARKQQGASPVPR